MNSISEHISASVPSVSLWQKPRKILVPLAEGLAWSQPGLGIEPRRDSHGNTRWVFQRKYDGSFATRELTRRDGRSVTLLGERMRFKSGGLFTPADLAMFQRHDEFFAAWGVAGNNIGTTQLAAWQDLLALRGELPADVVIAESSPNGGELLKRVLADGGEGVVAKDMDASLNAIMLACKARWEEHVRVSHLSGGNQSVFIEDVETGRPLGRLPLRGGKCDRVRPGSIIKACAMGITSGGKLREPRVDNDSGGNSWLVRY